MARQDKTGTKYEQFLAATLASLGYNSNSSIGKNYLHPNKRNCLVFPETYIQPDLIVREKSEVKAILYATHWSNTRDSKRKFWRTWEELAQQKLAVNTKLIGINCLFEALPENSQPQLYITSDDIPLDQTRDKKIPVPLQFNGWDAGIGWAMVEAFDVTLAFPVGYRVLDKVLENENGEDNLTKKLLEEALNKNPKQYFNNQWDLLDQKRLEIKEKQLILTDTKSSYRVGLLHIYFMYRFLGSYLNRGIKDLEDIIKSFSKISSRGVIIESLLNISSFNGVGYDEFLNVFNVLSNIQVKHKNKKEAFCSISRITNPSDPSKYIDYLNFNSKLSSCFLDLSEHLEDQDFINAIYRSFQRFDEAYGVNEAINDLTNLEAVRAKELFVRELFSDVLTDEDKVKKATGGALKFLSPLQATGHYGIFPTDRTTALQFGRPKGRGIKPSRD